jgi:DNA-binding NarL/FixJ family response regulator
MSRPAIQITITISPAAWHGLRRRATESERLPLQRLPLPPFAQPGSVEDVSGASGRPLDGSLPLLSARERTLLEHLGRGDTIRQAAARLNASVAEAGRLHRQLMQQLGLSTPLDLRRRAIRWVRHASVARPSSSDDSRSGT